MKSTTFENAGLLDVSEVNVCCACLTSDARLSFLQQVKSGVNDQFKTETVAAARANGDGNPQRSSSVLKVKQGTRGAINIE